MGQALWGDQSAVDTFLDSMPIPKVKAEHWNWLVSLISTEEVFEAIKQAKGGMAPGPYSFSALYYKKKFLLLCPCIWLAFFNFL